MVELDRLFVPFACIMSGYIWGDDVRRSQSRHRSSPCDVIDDQDGRQDLDIHSSASKSKRRQAYSRRYAAAEAAG